MTHIDEIRESRIDRPTIRFTCGARVRFMHNGTPMEGLAYRATGATSHSVVVEGRGCFIVPNSQLTEVHGE